MAINHTYYIPKQKKIVGPLADQVGHILYGIWLRDFAVEPHICDGVSVYETESGALNMVIIKSFINDEGQIKYKVFGPELCNLS